MNGGGTRHQGGLTLVELLVTTGLLAFVLISLGKLQTTLLLHHTLGRQQSLAVLLAGNGLSRLRLSLDAAKVPVEQLEGLGPDAHCGRIMEGLETCYKVSGHATETGGRLWRIEADVSWHDRLGRRQIVHLHSLAAAADPLAQAALYRPPVELLQPPPPP